MAPINHWSAVSRSIYLLFRLRFPLPLRFDSCFILLPSDNSLHGPLRSPHPLPQILAPTDHSQRPSSASEGSSVDPLILFLSFRLPFRHPFCELCSDFNPSLVAIDHTPHPSRHSPKTPPSHRSFHLLSSLPARSFACYDHSPSQRKNSSLPTCFPSRNDELR